MATVSQAWFEITVDGAPPFEAVLRAGDTLGRGNTTLSVDRAEIAELHGSLQARGGALALRNPVYPMRVDGEDVQEVALEPGQIIELAPAVTLSVLHVAVGTDAGAVRGSTEPVGRAHPVVVLYFRRVELGAPGRSDFIEVAGDEAKLLQWLLGRGGTGHKKLACKMLYGEEPSNKLNQLVGRLRKKLARAKISAPGLIGVRHDTGDVFLELPAEVVVVNRPDDD